MPAIDCDPERARERLEAAGVEIGPGNTDHERWRAAADDAVAIAYDDTIVVQGARPDRLVGLLREDGGRAYVYFDGAARGNPGPAAVGWVVVTGDGIAAEGGERIGETTSNRAEYRALLRALEVATDYGFETVAVRGDSELVVRQVRGEWEVNHPELREHRVRARELLERFETWSIDHVPREINERADELATEALDAG